MRTIGVGVSAALGALLLSPPAVASETSTITRAGQPWIHLGGVYAGPRSADATTRSRAIVQSYATNTSVVPSAVDHFGDGETIVRFAQSHRGLPVIGRGASVRLSATGRPLATVLDLESELPSLVVPTVSAEDAARIASARFALRVLATEAHLVVWPTLDRGARLAYAVLPSLPPGIPAAPRAIIDAETASILEARDLLAFAKASTYPQNPTKTPNVVSSDLEIAPTGPNLSSPFITATNCIDKKTVKAVSMFGFNLKAHICDLVQVATANASGDFVYEPSDVAGSSGARDDAFSEVAIYYHAAKAYSFFRELQGDPAAQVVVDKPLRLVANLQIPAGLMSGNIAMAADPNQPLETFQNAFYSPAGGGLGALFQQLYGFNTGALWFGQGPKRDYAYDGDVVYHEFSHAVVDATLKLGAWHVDAYGAVDAPGAMNEGLADYFSSAITGDPDVGEYAGLDLGGDTVIRTLANDDRCPGAIVGEVHADSTLFSGALWTARASLPEAERTKLDAGIYKAMRANPGRDDLGFDDLANLLLATLKADFPAGATAIETAMTARGILPSCDRVVSFEDKPIAARDPRLGFAAPGTQTVSVKGTAPGILQFRMALPPETASVEVSFVVRNRQGGAGLLGGNAEPFTPIVLGKLGMPITWDSKSKTGHDAELTAKVDAASGTVTATLEIPPGTTADSLYVQIANKGESDGNYDAVTLSFVPTVSTGEAPPEAAPPAATTTTIETGCSMSRTAAPPHAVGAMSLAVALLGAVRARRRATSRVGR